MSNLLVVDWDYFFPNPMEAGDTENRAIFLYDWGHREVIPRQDWLWPIRASQFLQHGMPLPKVEVPEGWWGRFKITADAILFVADSNMYAGTISPPDGDGFDNVWLYDAHHDAYLIRTVDDLAAWREKAQVTCETWMFAHHLRGADLHWRWPTWLPEPSNSVWPEWINLDAAQDDLLPVAGEFDTVFLCQSAAWVPPWNDQEFLRLIEDCPVQNIVQLDRGEGVPFYADIDLAREFDLAAAERQSEMITRLIGEPK